MLSATYGGKEGTTYKFEDTDDYIVVRTRNRGALNAARLGRDARHVANRLESVIRFPTVGVEVLKRRDVDMVEARTLLGREQDIRFAGRVLCDPVSGTPVVYTENLFLKLHDDVADKVGARVFAKLKFEAESKRRLPFARNAFFVKAPEGCGRDVFDMAAELLEIDEVQYCHPELVRERSKKHVFPEQWHLAQTKIDGNVIDAHVSVAGAWKESRGEGVVVAIIDDGVDLSHPEFASSNKIVSPRDATRDTFNANPFFCEDSHGTACAGVACADGVRGASGVAPDARLLPIRLVSGLGSIDEAEAFYWAARFGADVISCSWGPPDGDWWDSSDPVHNQFIPLPDSTRVAIEAAIDHGRNGLGCVVTWAAGNGNESVDNDGYASYDKVIAVAACNDQGTKSVYSDVGDALWCAFPSNDFNGALTPGIWTTDRTGSLGYNPGFSDSGDEDGLFTNSFGGTSSACPGAAGVAALILARNPNLPWNQVREIMKEGCDKIDEAGGGYDTNGHSIRYGYGRLNAETVVALAANA